MAIPIGILAAVRRETLLDKGITVFVFLGFAMPTFWLALLLVCLLLVARGLAKGSDDFSFPNPDGYLGQVWVDTDRSSGTYGGDVYLL